MKAWFVVASAAIAAGCVPVERNPAREVFGISAAAAGPTDGAHDVAARTLWAWKAAQICTVRGYDVEKEDVEPGEGNQWIVDWQLRCRPYRAMMPVRS